MRLISRPACAASLRQRCTSFSSSSSSGDSFLSGWRSMPGTNPATSQFDWLVSMTAISVLSWSKAARDRLRSFDCGMGHSIGLLDSAEGGMPSPRAPYHLHRGRPTPGYALCSTTLRPVPSVSLANPGGELDATYGHSDRCHYCQHGVQRIVGLCRA